jgi:hypothetical protein
VTLLDHTDQLQALLADPGQLPAAIDELIRFTAPVPHATFGRHPGLRLATGRDVLAWTHGDGLVLRGLASLPVVLGPGRAPGMTGHPIP